MNTISAVIITCNEERNIARCLNSLQGIADEVVVVDSGSTDETENICRSYGVRFEHHDWEGYSEQKNYADSLATQEWILSIDADEALSDTLRQNLAVWKSWNVDEASVYSVCRLTNYCGAWIRHCGWYPDEKVRLWRAGVGRWEGVVHEELHYSCQVVRFRLNGDLLHYSYYSVQDHAARQVKYAALAADKAFAQGRRCKPCDVWLKPVWTFVRNYLFKGGFLDGRAGYVVCRMSAFYTMIKYAKLHELGQPLRHK